LADALLRACPHVRLLATSREALGIAGETVWRVPSLPVPPVLGAAAGDAPPAAPADPADLARSAAVRLFCERAAAVRPGFALTAANAAAVVQVCRRLDGIPLALELAAARVRVLPPAPLLARLEDRFRLLTGGSRTALERHQTLQAAVAWSYDLLSDPERRLFARLAVFAGGWTLEAAEAVCAGDAIATADVLDLLTRLVDQSLVVPEELPDGTARYRLLETLRQYAQQKLPVRGAGAAARRRHLAFYLALAEAAAPRLAGPAPQAWVRRLEAEHENLRAALRWAADSGQPAAGLRLGGALWRFWFARGYLAEGRGWLAAAQAAADAAPTVRAEALHGAGVLARSQGAYAEAAALLEASLAIRREHGDAAGVAAALYDLGRVAHRRGEYGHSSTLLEESLALRRGVGDAHGAAEVLAHLGLVALHRGDAPAGRRYLEKSLGLFRALGSASGIATALGALGGAAGSQGDHERAAALLNESARLFGEAGNARRRAEMRLELARVTLGRGDAAAAAGLVAESLAVLRDLGAQRNLTEGLDLAGAVASAQRRWPRAVRLFGAAAAARAVLGLAAPPAGRARHERELAGVRGELADATFAAAWTEGQAMSLTLAVAYALEDAPDSA
jgi:non-specific serine/threonine protein kinase